MTKLRLSSDLSVPEDFATEGVLVTGMRGSGKTSTAIHFAEVLYDNGIPFVIVDPKGDTYGIRSSSDGKSPGLSVPVFGGIHGDFPLEPAMGARVADLLVDEVLSAVLDISQLSKTGGLPTFLTAFCNQLMHRHQLEPHVRTVILAEAHRYIPQQVKGAAGVLKEAAASLLLEGRAFGLGCWAETQRPARLNKDVVEEVGNAIVHRIGVAATNDKKTIAGWVAHYDLSSTIVDSLTSLAAGEAWVLSPEFDIVKRVRMDRRRTFDSGATPKAGQARKTPSTMADIDVPAIREALAEAIDRAERDDPRVLHRRIAELERQLRDQPTAEPIEVEKVVHEKWVPPELGPALKRFLSDWDNILTEIGGMGEGIAALVETIEQAADAEPATAPRAPMPPPFDRRPAVRLPSNGKTLHVEHTFTVTGDPLPEGEAKVLTATAQVGPATRQQLSILTGYKKSTRDAYIARLRTRGMVAVNDDGRVVATTEGIEKLGPSFTPLPTGEALRKHWLATLPEGEAKVLGVLCDAYPQPVAGDAVSDRTGFKKSTRDAYLQRLRARVLIEKSDGGHRAVDTLFA